MAQNMPRDERTLARELAALQRRVAALETAPRAGHTSISSGSLVVRDTDTGTVLASIAAGDTTDSDGNAIPAGISATVGDVDGAVLRPRSVDESKVTFSITAGGVTATVGVAPGDPLNANPDFEEGLTGWTGGGGALTLDTTLAFSGGASAKIVPDGVTANVSIISARVEVKPGDTVQAAGWLRCATARTLKMNVNWFTSAGTFISTSSEPVTVAAGTWTQVPHATFTVPAEAALASVLPTVNATPPAADVMWADYVTLTAPKVGDLWIDTGHGNLVNRWDGAAWQPLPVGTDAIQAGAVTTDLLAANAVAAGQIAAGAVTAETLEAVMVVATELQSTNYVAGASGWRIDGSGDTELNEVTARGEVTVIGEDGSEVLIRTNDGRATIDLQPPAQTGATFDPASIDTQSASDKTASVLFTSPRETSAGTNRAQVQLQGSDGSGATSQAWVIADNITLIGNVDVQGPISAVFTEWTAWTPAVTGGGAATFGTRDGWYSQFGDLIFFNAYITVSAAGTGTSQIAITLPVIPYRGSANRRQIYPGYLSGSVANGSQIGPISATTLAGSSTGIDQITMSNGTMLTGQMLTSSSIITVQGLIRQE